MVVSSLLELVDEVLFSYKRPMRDRQSIQSTFQFVFFPGVAAKDPIPCIIVNEPLSETLLELWPILKSNFTMWNGIITIGLSHGLLLYRFQ